MRNTLYIFVALASLYAEGQELIIKAKHRKAGIYNSFEEFKLNSPGQPLKQAVLMKGDSEENRVYLIHGISKDQCRKVGKVFGFCDGKDVYVLPYVSRITPKTQFYKLQNLDRLCCFYYKEIKLTAVGAVTAPLMVPIIRNVEDQYVLRLDDGVQFRLNNRNTRKIIASDTELSKSFEFETANSTSLIDFVLKYFERNPTNFEEYPIYNLTFYRYGKKELTEPVRIQVNGRPLEFRSPEIKTIGLKDVTDKITIQYGDKKYEFDSNPIQMAYFQVINTKKNGVEIVKKFPSHAKENLRYIRTVAN